MATLLFGGGFNPITSAHLLTAREAMERGGFNEVIFIPTGYDKYKGGGTPFHHRLAMVKLAVSGHDGFHFSDWEGEQAKHHGRMTYTIETYRYMRDNIGGKDVWWLIGSDNLSKIPRWKNFDAIRQEMKFCVLPRPGDVGINLVSLPARLRDLGMEGKGVEAPLLEISSTYVRERLAKGKSIRWLVPEAVEQYIQDHGLYKGE